MPRLFKRIQKRRNPYISPSPTATPHWVRRVVLTEETDLHTLDTQTSWVISWYQKPIDNLGEQREDKSEN
jgi:hypothetical protein